MKTANLKSHTTSEMSWNIYFQAFTVRTWRKRLSNLNTFLLPIYTGEYIPYLRNQQPAHGGADPGKVSASGIKEKDINLAITLKCKSVLEQNGIKVILTRSEDQSLEDGSSSNKKSSDLKKRKALIRESKINCAVSIHQNSFPDSSSCGAQVFYHPNYPESKRLAGLIQAQMHSLTGIENHRKIKANTDYYLLRDNDTPTVIAEVCFLSNPSEAAMIAEETIQEKAAFQIAMGIMQFLHVHPTNSPSILSET